LNLLKPILIVEDSSKDLELTIIALQRSRLANEFITLRDGAEALDYLRCEGEFAQQEKSHPAVILLDLKLPKVDGLEVLQAIKSDPDLKQIPVVMLTSSREEKDLVQSYKLGVNAYVVKPVIFDDFLEAVQGISGFWVVLNELPPNSVRLKT
jgi:CheY-like chemotaxis protein